MRGMFNRQSHREAVNRGAASRATEPFNLVHTDMWGPVAPATHGDLRFAIIFVDDATRYRAVYLMANKGEATACLKKFMTEFPAKRDLKIKRLRADSAVEYQKGRFKQCCDDEGITQEFSAPYTQNQNGVAERSWRTLAEKARTMLIASGLSRKFWGYAMLHATLLVNISPTTALPESSCPYEALNGQKPDLTYLKVFGAAAYVHVDKTSRTKLANRARKGYYVGVSVQPKSGFQTQDNSSQQRMRNTTKLDISTARREALLTSYRQKIMKKLPRLRRRQPRDPARRLQARQPMLQLQRRLLIPQRKHNDKK